MAARLSSSIIRGFSRLAACRSSDNAVGSTPSGLFGGVYNQAATTGMLEQRDIKYDSADVNNIKIHFAKAGHGNNTILLLPGALGCGETDFVPQLEGINKDLFTLISWDPRGYGRSQDTSRDWCKHFLERDAHDAAGLMKVLEYDRYNLVGWSDGGITALFMAARYPNRIRKCVTLGANAYITAEEVETYRSIADISNWSERMRKPFVDVYGEAKFHSLWSEWIEWFLTYYDEPEGNVCKHILKDIKCPLLVTQGEKDALVPSFHADFIANNVEGSRLVKFPDGKHNLHFKSANVFNSLVENFLLEPVTNQVKKPDLKIPEQ